LDETHTRCLLSILFFFFSLAPLSLSAPISAPRRSGWFPCTTTAADMTPRGKTLITRPRTPQPSLRDTERARSQTRGPSARSVVLFEEPGTSSPSMWLPLHQLSPGTEQVSSTVLVRACANSFPIFISGPRLQSVPASPARLAEQHTARPAIR